MKNVCDQNIKQGKKFKEEIYFSTERKRLYLFHRKKEKKNYYKTKIKDNLNSSLKAKKYNEN